MAADRVNAQLMGSYGEQRPVSGAGDKIDVSTLFFASEVGETEQEIIRRGRIRFLLVDRRLSSGLPMTGVYIEEGEPGSLGHTTPMNPAVLAKFDGVESVSRIYDSGDIVIYELRDVSGEVPAR